MTARRRPSKATGNRAASARAAAGAPPSLEGAGPRDRSLGEDWPAHARRIEFGLTAETPTHADVHLHTDPMPLDLDYHSALECGLVLEGEHERHYHDSVMRVLPGQVWLCAMWEPHGWRATPGTREVVVMFIPELLGDERLGEGSWLDLFALPPEGRPQFRTEEARRAALAIGQELAHEALTKPPGWVSGVKFNVLRLLLLLRRQGGAPIPPDRTLRGTTTLARIVPALDLLHRQPAFRVSMAEAAAACGLSRSHFDLLFRRAMGLSFGRFSLRARLAAAAYQLATTESPLEAIAGHSGFVDASHLHRAFQRHYGCTPAAYRKQFR